jgi:ABC-type proline/glycine betaine transport system permease subunit
VTGIIALTAYALQIIYRNMVAGLNNVPAEAKDAGRGMGMTENQLFWRVELPLSVPEIVAGLRIATVSTVAIATLAFLAGAGGLGAQIYNQIDFKTNVLIAGGLCVAMAIVFDLLLLLLQRWRRRGGPGGPHDPAARLHRAFGDAIEFIFTPQENRFTGGRKVGGLDQVWELT